jgi:transcriptional regulator with XRE-family HTH domain
VRDTAAAQVGAEAAGAVSLVRRRARREKRLSFRGLIYIERGQRNPSILTVADIAKALDVTPSELTDHLSAE